MAKTLELITISEIMKKTKLKRDSIYKTYRSKFVQIPTNDREAHFDKESVIKAFADVRKASYWETEKMFSDKIDSKGDNAKK